MDYLGVALPSRRAIFGQIPPPAPSAEPPGRHHRWHLYVLHGLYVLYLPSGKRLHNRGKSPCLRTVNHLFLWTIFHGKLLVITRGYQAVPKMTFLNPPGGWNYWWCRADFGPSADIDPGFWKIEGPLSMTTGDHGRFRGPKPATPTSVGVGLSGEL